MTRKAAGCAALLFDTTKTVAGAMRLLTDIADENVRQETAMVMTDLAQAA